MKIEDIKIEDAADANYVIRKFFNNDFSNLKMANLEQLVLAVYAMGKNNGIPTDGGAPVEVEPAPAPEVPPVKENPFKINDRVKTLEDIEIAHSGEFIKTDTVGTVNLIKGDTATVVFEADEDGELIETNVLFDKLEKVS